MFHSQLEYRDLLDKLIQPGTRWLDIGCGRTIVPDWIRGSVEFQRELISRCEIALGCDPVDARPHVAGLEKYVGDCTVLPYADEFFNLVTANMVVEHVRDPVSFIREVRRVLAPGGKFVFHTPNLANPAVFLARWFPSGLIRRIANKLDSRSHEDIFPAYYRMNTRRAISSLPGLEILDMRCVPTQFLYKLPVLGSLEAWLVGRASRPVFKEIQADWIVVTQKPGGDIDNVKVNKEAPTVNDHRSAA